MRNNYHPSIGVGPGPVAEAVMAEMKAFFGRMGSSFRVPPQDWALVQRLPPNDAACAALVPQIANLWHGTLQMMNPMLAINPILMQQPPASQHAAPAAPPVSNEPALSVAQLKLELQWLNVRVDGCIDKVGLVARLRSVQCPETVAHQAPQQPAAERSPATAQQASSSAVAGDNAPVAALLAPSTSGVLTNGRQAAVCAACQQTAAAAGVDKLRRCGRCRRVYYCSTACLDSHYKQHRAACKEMAVTAATAGS